MIDEVESLTRSRSETKNEPSDGLRVVNALLTQIDQLKAYSNVLVLATSNLRSTIDDAFLDRADVAYEVGLPTQATAYDILRSSIVELQTKGLLSGGELFNYKLVACSDGQNGHHGDMFKPSHQLLDIVDEMSPKSARYLRKVTFMTAFRSTSYQSMFLAGPVPSINEGGRAAYQPLRVSERAQKVLHLDSSGR